jgi:hypothetical protein
LEDILEDLSQLSWLLTALWDQAGEDLMPSVTYHDLLQTCKAFFVFVAACMEEATATNKPVDVHLSLIGSDFLEELFSILRTLDHHREVTTSDIEVKMGHTHTTMAVYAAHPDWRMANKARDIPAGLLVRSDRFKPSDVNAHGLTRRVPPQRGSQPKLPMHWSQGRMRALAFLKTKALVHNPLCPPGQSQSQGIILKTSYDLLDKIATDKSGTLSVSAPHGRVLGVAKINKRKGGQASGVLATEAAPSNAASSGATNSTSINGRDGATSERQAEDLEEDTDDDIDDVETPIESIVDDMGRVVATARDDDELEVTSAELEALESGTPATTGYDSEDTDAADIGRVVPLKQSSLIKDQEGNLVSLRSAVRLIFNGVGVSTMATGGRLRRAAYISAAVGKSAAGKNGLYAADSPVLCLHGTVAFLAKAKVGGFGEMRIILCLAMVDDIVATLKGGEQVNARAIDAALASDPGTSLLIRPVHVEQLYSGPVAASSASAGGAHTSSALKAGGTAVGESAIRLIPTLIDTHQLLTGDKVCVVPTVWVKVENASGEVITRAQTANTKDCEEAAAHLWTGLEQTVQSEHELLQRLNCLPLVAARLLQADTTRAVPAPLVPERINLEWQRLQEPHLKVQMGAWAACPICTRRVFLKDHGMWHHVTSHQLQQGDALPLESMCAMCGDTCGGYTLKDIAGGWQSEARNATTTMVSLDELDGRNEFATKKARIATESSGASVQASQGSEGLARSKCKHPPVDFKYKVWAKNGANVLVRCPHLGCTELLFRAAIPIHFERHHTTVPVGKVPKDLLMTPSAKEEVLTRERKRPLYDQELAAATKKLKDGAPKLISNLAAQKQAGNYLLGEGEYVGLRIEKTGQREAAGRDTGGQVADDSPEAEDSGPGAGSGAGAGGSVPLSNGSAAKKDNNHNGKRKTPTNSAAGADVTDAEGGFRAAFNLGDRVWPTHAITNYGGGTVIGYRLGVVGDRTVVSLYRVVWDLDQRKQARKEAKSGAGQIAGAAAPAADRFQELPEKDLKLEPISRRTVTAAVSTWYGVKYAK